MTTATQTKSRVHLEFECLTCDEQWGGPLPRKFQTPEYASRQTAAWFAKHAGHLQSFRDVAKPAHRTEGECE